MIGWLRASPGIRIWPGPWVDIYLLEYLFKACTSKLFSKRQRGSQILLLPRGVKRNFFLRSLSPVDPILNSPAPPPGLTCSVLPPSPLRTYIIGLRPALAPRRPPLRHDERWCRARTRGARPQGARAQGQLFGDGAGGVSRSRRAQRGRGRAGTRLSPSSLFE